MLALRRPVIIGSTTQSNVLTGSVAADSITGGSAIDTIIGGAGVDTIVGGAANDVRPVVPVLTSLLLVALTYVPVDLETDMGLLRAQCEISGTYKFILDIYRMMGLSAPEIRVELPFSAPKDTTTLEEYYAYYGTPLLEQVRHGLKSHSKTCILDNPIQT